MVKKEGKKEKRKEKSALAHCKAYVLPQYKTFLKVPALSPGAVFSKEIEGYCI